MKEKIRSEPGIWRFYLSDVPNKMGIPSWEFRLSLGRTRIDYDPDKEEANRRKHGYSLESAVEQLERILLPLGTPSPSMTSDAFLEEGEVRHMHIGVDDCGKVVMFVTTMRSPEVVRIISFRRANREERKQFFQHTGFQEKD